MRSIVTLLVVAATAAAAPKVPKLEFRNLYKTPLEALSSKPNPRIIGGQEAIPHSLPYQVFLTVYWENEGVYCGGALVSPNYVVTAAHCCEGALYAYVTLGAHNRSAQEDTRITLLSTEITTNPDHIDIWSGGDLAVIKLPTPVEYTAAIQPINLPSHSDVNNDYVGSLAIISGWGVYNADHTASEVLKYLEVEVISDEACEEAFGLIPPKSVCTSGEGNVGVCSGDSGGPLVVDGVLIGVPSFVETSCVEGYPSGYTRITLYLDWLEENTDVKIE